MPGPAKNLRRRNDLISTRSPVCMRIVASAIVKAWSAERSRYRAAITELVHRVTFFGSSIFAVAIGRGQCRAHPS